MANKLDNKLCGILFVLMLIVSSNFIMVGLSSTEKAPYASANGKVDAGTGGYGASSGSRDFGTSWSASALGDYADGAGSVELVIGVSNQKNSYAGLWGIVSKYSGEVTNTVSMGTSKAIVVNMSTAAASAFVG